MTKSEFISRLRTALNGKVAPGVVTENVNYYEEYISTEIRKGRSEEEVLSSLGDPRLIARTIVETSGSGDGGIYGDGDEGNSYREYGGQNSYGAQSQYDGYDRNGNFGQGKSRGRVFRVPGWVWLLAVILLVVVIFGVFFSILAFLMPIVLPILVVIFLVKLFRDWLN